MPNKPNKPTSLHVHRVRAAGRIAPLLSWRALRELPLPFRVVFLLIGLALLGLVIALALLPLIAVVAGSLG